MENLSIQIFKNDDQKRVITSHLNILLKNNDIKLIDEILSFLSSECYECGKHIVNPQIVGNSDLCDNCMNFFIYCDETNCKNLKINPKYKDRCNQGCLSWYCKNHEKECECIIKHTTMHIKGVIRKIKEF